MAENDNIWRSVVNSYKGNFPEDGTNAPKIESIVDESQIKDGESPVVLQKIVTEIYVYNSLDTNEIWGKTQSFQDIQLLGTMRLSEAISIIETAKKKRRRRR